jgi:thiaminase (transcriptional activator TenA)
MTEPAAKSNQRRTIRPDIQVRNLPSRLPSAVTRRLPADWQNRCGYAPILAEPLGASTVQAAGSHFLFGQKTGLLQHREMLAYGGSGHLEGAGDLSCGKFAMEHQPQDGAAAASASTRSVSSTTVAVMTVSREAGTEVAFSASLRRRCDRIWAGLHAHPFLGELTRGTLPLEALRFFIEQDLPFLPAFARCMAMGTAKSASEQELEFFTRQLDGIIRLEIPSNRRLLDQVISLGAQDRGGSLRMAPANVAYTSFLLATATAGGPLEITAAILPCLWSYVEIARGLKDELAEHPVYSDWVGFYLRDVLL